MEQLQAGTYLKRLHHVKQRENTLNPSPVSRSGGENGTNTPGPSVSLGRVLLVGHVDFAARMRLALEQGRFRMSLQSIGGYIMALGEVGVRPPDLILGSVEMLGDLASPFASAVARLAPGARLVAVATPEEAEDGHRAVQNGFHAMVVEPVSAADLARLPVLSAKAPPAPPEPAAPEPPARPVPPGQSAMPPPVPAEELGDIDLVAHLIEHRAGVENLAVRLARAQSRINLRWIPAGQAAPSEGVATAVGRGDRSFGQLVAPGDADPDVVRGWAGWMGQWLTLQQRISDLYQQAMTDPMTGIWNRRYFDQALEMLLGQATTRRFRVTLLVFDIDDFKIYNDRFGHAAGDEILAETARLLRSVVRDHDVVARIGGDEFAVIFWDAEGPRRPNSRHPTDVMRAAERFRKAVRDHRFVKLRDMPGSLAISGGLASFPWDGRTPAELLERADQMAIQSKNEGKNAITYGQMGRQE